MTAWGRRRSRRRGGTSHASTLSFAGPLRRNRAIAMWLLICCALIVAMVVLGGITRLSHAGLSIVDWRPLMGVLPPLDEAEWQAAFAKYRAFPEYRKLNLGMSLAEFQDIFWLEYLHRLLGRLIGLVFLVPLVVFWLRGRIDRHLAPRLLALFALGGLQGLLGWYMVRSGLVDRPDVSQYRLTAHLGLALIIYGFMLHTAMGLLISGPLRAPRGAATALVAFIFVVALSGGFVAGLDAGFAYNTFPLMDGSLVPAEAFEQRPLWRNLFENVAAVQFEHRVLAIALVVTVAVFWMRARRRARSARAVLNGLLAAALLQVGLGISTLLLVVPLPLAAAHQAGAILLFTMAIWSREALRAD